MTRPARPPQVVAATPGGRSLLFTLEIGEGLPRHAHPHHRVVIAVLSGEVRLTTDEADHSLKAAELTLHDGAQPLALEALAPGTRLLVTLLGEA